MAKAEQVEEPDLAEVNRLLRGAPAPGTVGKTVDIEYAFNVLRSENARLKETAKKLAETEASNEETHKREHAAWRRETIRLQNELLAAQERVYQLQAKLLALRALINDAQEDIA